MILLFVGWMTTEDEYSSGNYGLFDQHQALSFVKENIKAFRGDPNQITLAGEGAGSTSVGMHLLSPWSRQKSKRAIDSAILVMYHFIHISLMGIK